MHVYAESGAHTPTRRHADRLRQALRNWQQDIYSTDTGPRTGTDVQTKHWLLEALRSRLPLPHTHRHCISVSPKPYSPHRWEPPGPFPNSPPFLVPEAAGSWIPRARRATKRKLWAVMFLLPAPNKVRPRGL